MPRKRFSAEEIIQHLRMVEIEQAKGSSLEEAARKIGVTTQTGDFGSIERSDSKSSSRKMGVSKRS